MISKNPSFDVFRNYIEPEFSEEPDPNEPFEPVESQIKIGGLPEQKKHDPLDDKIKGYEFSTGPVTIKNIKLPVSGKVIGYTFPEAPTKRNFQAFVQDADRRASTAQGKLHPSLAKQFDQLPFRVNDLLEPYFSSSTIPVINPDGTRGTISRDDALNKVAELLGLKNPDLLKLNTSPEYSRFKFLVNQWNSAKSKASRLKKFNAFSGTPFPVKIYIPYLLEAEGKYSNDTGFDAGGPTKYGITDADTANFPKGISAGNIKNLSLDQALKIYNDKYWMSGWAGLPAPSTMPNLKLAFVMMDTKHNPLSDRTAPGFSSHIRSIFYNPNLTDDQKADAIMDFRIDMYRKYSLPDYVKKLTPEELKKHREALVNRIKYKLRPFVNSLPKT